MPQLVLCGLSAPLSFCHTPDFWGEADRVIPNLSRVEWPQGNAAWSPAVDQLRAGRSCTCAWAQGGCTAASHPVIGSIQCSRAFAQNPDLRKDKNGSSNHWVSPLRNSRSTLKCQLTQEAFSVAQGAQFMHELILPDHTLAGQLRPLFLSSAACSGKGEYNHHQHRPQQTSQVCQRLEILVLLSRLQTCLKNVQRGKSDVSRAHPSLMHKTDLPCASPVLHPSEADEVTVAAAAQQGCARSSVPPAPQLQHQHRSHIHSPAGSRGQHCPPVPVHIHSNPFLILQPRSFLDTLCFWSCKWFLWFALCWQHVQRSRLLIHWSAINSSLTQTGH